MKVITPDLTRKIGRQVLIVKKNSPHIFFAGGIAGFVGTVVLASRATMKLGPVMDEFNEDVEQVKGLARDAADGGNHYTAEDYKRDMAYVYGKGTINIAKLYFPAVAVGAFSIAALTGSHISMTRRNIALTAAYTALSEAFDSYRERVQLELSPNKELDIYHAAEDKEVKNEDGSKEIVKFADPNQMSPYAKFFDESSRFWEKNAELNRLYLQCQQGYANNLLQARGHVFLNEVYDMIGVDRSKAGAVVGWVIGNGDNFIDFGIFEASNSRFVNGWERSILLDFNVDGVIYDKI